MWAGLIFLVGRCWVCRDQDRAREMCCPVPAWTGRVHTHPILVSMTTSLSSGVKVKSSSQEGGTLQGAFTAFFFPRKKERRWRLQTQTNATVPVSNFSCRTRTVLFPWWPQTTKDTNVWSHLEQTFPFIFPPAVRVVNHPWDRSTTNRPSCQPQRWDLPRQGKNIQYRW